MIPAASQSAKLLFQVCIFGVILRFSEDRDDVLNLYHEQAIITFEIDGDGTFGIEQHFVVLAQRYVRRGKSVV